MKKMLVLFLVCAANLFSQNAQTSSPIHDVWEPLRFLFGTWKAETRGGSAGVASTGTYSFRLELKDHILARHVFAEGCTGPADFNCEHGDLLIIYQEASGKPLKAIYFDNEGHVIHYEVSTPGTKRAVFLSAPSQSGPQYRLSYELRDETMLGRFEMCFPGRMEFTTYLEWSGAKN